MEAAALEEVEAVLEEVEAEAEAEAEEAEAEAARQEEEPEPSHTSASSRVAGSQHAYATEDSRIFAENFRRKWTHPPRPHDLRDLIPQVRAGRHMDESPYLMLRQEPWLASYVR